jgi:hypothetical protein
MFIINTYIKDIDTGETLPGASVLISDKNGKSVPVNGVNPVGRAADADGKVIIPIANENDYITVSYVGYQTISHPADDYRNDIIYLKRKTNVTKEAVVTAKRIKPKQEEKPKPVQHPKPKKKSRWLIIALMGATVLSAAYIIYTLTKKK